MSEFHRIVVVGSSCCGKTTFAKRLTELLQIPHVELDALHWGPNWQPRPLDEFRRLVQAFLSLPGRGQGEGHVSNANSQDSWIVDGNYSIVRDLFWPRATQVIWLNYSFPTVFRRAVSRSLAAR